MPNLIEVENLTKTYGETTAVDHISFDIPAGIVFGLLGPNGAGKTTTVEMLEGIKQPDAGVILYKGKPLGKAFKREAGIMFQHTTLQDYITVREALQLFANLYPKQASIEQLIDDCALGDFLDQNTHKLSGGQLQRVLLAIALVNDPEIVFLDEPTTGLDPQARRNFWNLVERIKSKGKTVVLTTHYMDEAKVLCDHLLFMDHGKIIAQGSPTELLANQFSDVIIQIPLTDLQLEQLPESFEAQVHDDYVEIKTASVNQALEQLMGQNINLQQMNIRSHNLDDLFLELTGHELRN